MFNRGILLVAAIALALGAPVFAAEKPYLTNKA